MKIIENENELGGQCVHCWHFHKVPSLACVCCHCGLCVSYELYHERRMHHGQYKDMLEAKNPLAGAEVGRDG